MLRSDNWTTLYDPEHLQSLIDNMRATGKKLVVKEVTVYNPMTCVLSNEEVEYNQQYEVIAVNVNKRPWNNTGNNPGDEERRRVHRRKRA